MFQFLLGTLEIKKRLFKVLEDNNSFNSFQVRWKWEQRRKYYTGISSVSIPFRYAGNGITIIKTILKCLLFQFLLGTLEMSIIMGLIFQKWGVSIPFRYAGNIKASLIFSHASKVSIPFRYAGNDNDLIITKKVFNEFQFLLGTLEIIGEKTSNILTGSFNSFQVRWKQIYVYSL